ncbi:MAG: pilus assembly protein [Deltaproteobacteria bacterium]|nr:pilus assembly protein [Deltaproteobacteria bacterium]
MFDFAGTERAELQNFRARFGCGALSLVFKTAMLFILFNALSATESAVAQTTATPPPFANVVPADEPEKEVLEAAKADPKRQKTVGLFIGVEHQEKLPFLPTGAKFKGDYKKVAKLSLDSDRGILLFQATQEGFATLTVYDKDNNRLYDFSLDVKKSNLTKVVREMRALLADIEGITVKIINNRVVVDGQVLLPRDLSRILAVIAQYGETQASSLVTLSPVAQRKIAQLIVNHINNPEITVNPINDKFILEGTVGDSKEMERAVQIAQMYVPDMIKEAGEKEGTIIKVKKEFVLNLIRVRDAPPKEPAKIIQIVVHFVELSKSYTKGFRFQFTPEISDNSGISISNDSRSPGGIVSSITAVITNLLPKLNWAKEHGHARVLESTTLLVTDGSTGKISNETAIPYTVFSASTNNASSNTANIGITAEIGAKINNPRSDAIEMVMNFGMAQLVDMNAGQPIVSKSLVNTKVTVRSGQSAAIGGLILNSSNTAYNKLPQSVQNPLISLYASKQFTRKQSQFVVFVTPVIKVSASQGSEKIKAKFKLRD